MSTETTLPKRPASHVTGDRAVNFFKYHGRHQWVTNSIDNDYGIDLLVAIEKDETVQEQFFVQIKGSESPKYLKGKKAISVKIDTRTLNWVLSQAIPTMLFICDTRSSPEFGYYVWLNDEISQIEKKMTTSQGQIGEIVGIMYRGRGHRCS